MLRFESIQSRSVHHIQSPQMVAVSLKSTFNLPRERPKSGDLQYWDFGFIWYLLETPEFTVSVCLVIPWVD
jgi:hypothetical protein